MRKDNFDERITTDFVSSLVEKHQLGTLSNQLDLTEKAMIGCIRQAIESGSFAIHCKPSSRITCVFEPYEVMIESQKKVDDANERVKAMAKVVNDFMVDFSNMVWGEDSAEETHRLASSMEAKVWRIKGE